MNGLFDWRERKARGAARARRKREKKQWKKEAARFLAKEAKKEAERERYVALLQEVAEMDAAFYARVRCEES